MNTVKTPNISTAIDTTLPVIPPLVRTNTLLGSGIYIQGSHISDLKELDSAGVVQAISYITAYLHSQQTEMITLRRELHDIISSVRHRLDTLEGFFEYTAANYPSVVEEHAAATKAAERLDTPKLV